jgi:anti-anti-sigma factor
MNDPRDLLSVQTEDHGAHKVIIVQGEVDIYTAEILHAALEEAEPVAGSLIIDLTGVDHLSACGFRLLLAADERAHEQGYEVRLAGGRPIVLRTLQLLGQNQCPRHYPDRDTALHATSPDQIPPPSTPP